MRKPVRITPELKTPVELRKLARALLMLVEESEKPKKSKPSADRKAS